MNFCLPPSDVSRHDCHDNARLRLPLLLLLLLLTPTQFAFFALLFMLLLLLPLSLSPSLLAALSASHLLSALPAYSLNADAVAHLTGTALTGGSEALRSGSVACRCSTTEQSRAFAYPVMLRWVSMGYINCLYDNS